MNTLNFLFNETQLKIYGTVEDPVFVVNDICDIIGLNKKSHFIRSIKNDQRFREGKFDTPQIPQYHGQQLAVINERGLYEIMFRSNSKLCEQFKDEICEWLKQQRLSQNLIKDQQIQTMQQLINQLKKENEDQKQNIINNTIGSSYNHRIIKFVKRDNQEKILYAIYFDEKYRSAKIAQTVQMLLQIYDFNEMLQVNDMNHYRKCDAREQVKELRKIHHIECVKTLV